MCFRKVLESNYFWIKRLSRFSRIFLSHSAEKLRGEPFNVSEAFWYSNKIKDERWGLSRFSVEFFFLSEPKIFVGGHLCFRNVLLAKNVRTKGVSLFSPKFFVTQCRRMLSGNPSVFHKNLWYGKNLWIIGGGAGVRGGGVNRNFREKFYVSQYQKNTYGGHFGGSEKF